MTASSIAVVALVVATLLQHGGCHPTPQSPADRGARSLRISYRPWYFSAVPRLPVRLLSPWSPPRAELPARRATPFWELPPLVQHQGTIGSGLSDYSVVISVAAPTRTASRLPVRYNAVPAVTTLARPTRPPPMPSWVRLPPGTVAAPLFDLVESAQSAQQPIISINRPAVGPRTTSITYLPAAHAPATAPATAPAPAVSPDRHSEEGATGAAAAAAAPQGATTTTTAATAEYSVLVVTRVGEETTATPWPPSGTTTPPSTTAWASEAAVETSTVPSQPDLPAWTAAATTAVPASEATTVGATDGPTTATAPTLEEDSVTSVTSEAQPPIAPSTLAGTAVFMTEPEPFVTTPYVTEEPYVTTPYVTEEPSVTTSYVTEEPFGTTPEVTSSPVVTTALPEKPTALTESPALTDSATEDGLDTIEIEINRLNKEEEAAAGTLGPVVVDAETTVTSSTDTATTSQPFEGTTASSDISEVFSTSADMSDAFSTASQFPEAFSTTMDPSQAYPTTFEEFSTTPGSSGSTDTLGGDLAVSTGLPPTTADFSTTTDSTAREAPSTAPTLEPTVSVVPVTATTPLSGAAPTLTPAVGTATTGFLYNRQTTGVPTPGPVRDFDYYDGVVFEDSAGSPADGYIPDYDDRSGEYDGDYFADSSSATRLQPPPWSDTKGLEIQSLVRETPPSDVHRRSDVLPEDEEDDDDDNEVGVGSDHEAASSAAPLAATATKVYGDTFEGQMLRRMVPLVVRQLRLGHVSAEDLSRLQYIFGPIWPEVEQLARAARVLEVGRRRRNSGRLRWGRARRAASSYPHFTRWRGDGQEALVAEVKAARRQPSVSRPTPARRRRPQKSPRKKSSKKGHGHRTGPAAEGAASRKPKLHKDHARKGERLNVRKDFGRRPKRSSHHAVEDQDYEDEDGDKDYAGEDSEDYDSEDESNEEYDEQEEEEEADEDVVPSRVFDADQDNPSVMELHYRARQSDSFAVPLHGPGRGPKPARPSRPSADETKAASAVEYEYY